MPVRVIGDAIDWLCKRNPVAAHIKLDGMEPNMYVRTLDKAVRRYMGRFV
jgi:hypothetical protein